MLATPLPYMSPVPVSMAQVWLQAARVSVPAGFSSPAEDHLVDRIELMSQLVRHPQAAFFVRIAGDSMQGTGILHDSVVLVDKSIDAPQKGGSPH